MPSNESNSRRRALVPIPDLLLIDARATRRHYEVGASLVVVGSTAVDALKYGLGSIRLPHRFCLFLGPLAILRLVRVVLGQLLVFRIGCESAYDLSPNRLPTVTLPSRAPQLL
jgi:hypothetical protein